MKAVNPALRETAVDRAQTSLRTITSIVDVAAPGLGSVFGELVNVILPANREERMAQFVTKLDLRLKALSIQLGALLHHLDAEQLALIEDGLRASARATQEARIGRISDIVAAGIASGAAAGSKREILDLLSSLSDNDLVVLAGFANRRGYDATRSPTMTVGIFNALTQEEQAAHRLARSQKQLSVQKLVSSGLLGFSYGIDTSDLSADSIPRNVAVGKTPPKLTTLGEHFAKQIGLWPPEEGNLIADT